MQFQVPQFIEVEDKIIGPLTFKQFVYVAGAAGMSYVAWSMLPKFIAIMVIPAVMGGGAALAFLQWNGRPFILALESGFYYLINSKLYLWSSQRKNKLPIRATALATNADIGIPKLAGSRLHDLAWSLDIKENLSKAGLTKPGERRQDIMSAIKTRQGFGMRT